MVLISLNGSAKVRYGLPSQSVNVPALRRRRREKVPSLEFCREGHKRGRDLAISLQGMRIPFLAINQIYEQPQPKRSIPAAARLAPHPFAQCILQIAAGQTRGCRLCHPSSNDSGTELGLVPAENPPALHSSKARKLPRRPFLSGEYLAPNSDVQQLLRLRVFDVRRSCLVCQCVV
jgi:hypothetical protein